MFKTIKGQIVLMMLIGMHWNTGTVLGDKISTKLQPFPMTQIRLSDGPFNVSQDINRKYLDSFDTNMLLKNFRVNAGLPAPGKSMSGWEAPDCVIRGHFTGHYLSAVALMYASTGDEKLKEKGTYMVQELGKCQIALGGQYLSAFPESAWDVVEASKPNWAQYYTVHKIMAGLFDQYQHCNNPEALKILTGMASYFKKRLDKFSPDQMAAILNCTEEGGMCDVLWNIYSATDDPNHRDLAIKFEKHSFLDSLALGQDNLTRRHGNTHIPLIIGAERRYELTGDEKYKNISQFFWDRVVNARCYATGGTTLFEVWPEANKLADTLGYRNQECCKTYNLLKVTRHLFCWTGDPNYTDYYERALFNGILGTNDTAEGRLMYYIPLQTGFQKSVLSLQGHSFCCTGTGIESHSKFCDSIYFHDDASIYVNLFIASKLNWEEKGIQLEQQTKFPNEDTASFIIHSAKPVSLALNIHVPYWATRGVEVSVNGSPLSITSKPSSYVTLKRTWADNDKVVVRMPMSLHKHPMPDVPDIMAFMYGPLVLAGITENADATMPYIIPPDGDFPEKELHFNADFMTGDAAKLETWIKPVKGKSLCFRTVGQSKDITFIPFYQVTGQRYGVYWEVAKPDSPRYAMLKKKQSMGVFMNRAEAFKASEPIEPLRKEFDKLKDDPELSSYQEKMVLGMANAEMLAGNKKVARELVDAYDRPFLLRDMASKVWSITGKPEASGTDVKPLLVDASMADGSIKKMKLDERYCIATDAASKKQSHIYFSVPDNSPLHNVNQTVTMTVTYYSEGKAGDKFFIEYDAFADPLSEGAYTQTRIVEKSATAGWHTVTLECPHARFSGRQNAQADFRVNSFDENDEYIGDIRLSLQ